MINTRQANTRQTNHVSCTYRAELGHQAISVRVHICAKQSSTVNMVKNGKRTHAFDPENRQGVSAAPHPVNDPAGNADSGTSHPL